MNYRKILFVIAGVLGALIVLFFVVMAVRFPKCNRPTVFFSDVSFGMSQREITDTFGNPLEVTKDPHNSQDFTYYYELEVADHEAKVYFTFKKFSLRNQLYCVSIDFGETTDTEALAQLLTDMIKDEYEQEEGYYIKKGSINYANIGVQNGAVGVDFAVNVSQSTVSVLALCDEYDG